MGGNSHDWSFSEEWNRHFDSGLVRTWGWSVEERLAQFLLEANVDPDWCEGKWILDAGCGNGQLSEGLTKLGASVVGLDYSTSVFRAERMRQSTRVYFVRGDLQAPPFADGTFDLVVSNGVLHHTPNTFRTFSAVSRLVKPGGRFYVWLYRKSEKFFRRYLSYPSIDLARIIAARIPRAPQGLVVRSYAFALLALHKALRKRQDRAWPERIVDAYDTLTPLYRHYHTPLEVACWFFLNGYSAPTITHWDNAYGFGMVAAKVAQRDTPGMNFGKTGAPKRYWS